MIREAWMWKEEDIKDCGVKKGRVVLRFPNASLEDGNEPAASKLLEELVKNRDLENPTAEILR